VSRSFQAKLGNIKTCTLLKPLHRAVPPLKIKNFRNPRTQDGGGRHLKNSKNRHISAAVRPISTTFGTVTQLGHVERPDR